MRKFIKILFGLIFVLCGLILMFAGGYLLLTERSWASVGVFIPFFCIGLLVLFLGYDSIKGRSIKDDLFFLFFN
jgi:hypothetical protein